MPFANDSVTDLLLEHGRLAEHVQVLDAERQRVMAEQSGVRARLAARLGSVQDAEVRGRILEIFQMYKVAATAVADWGDCHHE